MNGIYNRFILLTTKTFTLANDSEYFSEKQYPDAIKKSAT